MSDKSEVVLRVNGEENELHEEEIMKHCDEWNLFNDEVRWYENENPFEDCLREYSRKFPELIFEFTIYYDVGEFFVWREYFKNGKRQKVKGKVIYQFEEFDENLLE